MEAWRSGVNRFFVGGLLLAVLLVTGAVQAQELEVKAPAKRPEKKDDPGARQRYLEELRAGKSGFIPSGARLRALQEMDELIREEGERYWRFRTKTQGTTSSTSRATGTIGTSSVAGQDPSIANGTPTSSQWLFIGPRPTNSSVPSSGRTSAIVVDPRDTNGNTVYIGGAQGGVWKTTDSGLNWIPLMDGATIPSLAVGSMAIDATTNPSTVYVGTGEQGSAFDSYYGAGVLKSADGGTTWTQLGADKFAGPIAGCDSNGFACGGAFIGGLSVRPGGLNPATILAAVSLPTGLANGSGIYRTTDGGVNWTRVHAGTTQLGATAVQYATSDIAYAGFDSLGVFRSPDGGATWFVRNGSGPTALTPGGRIELSVALSDPSGDTVYASVGSGGSGSNLAGFYKTTDGGLTWLRLGPVSAPGLVDYCTPQCWYDNVVAVNPVDASVVFVGGSAVSRHLSKTVDGGSNWAAATSSIHVDHHAAAFTPNGTRLYWGNDGGVYRTENATASTTSATWTNLNTNLGITQFYSNFALHPTDINVTFGGTQDNGTQRYDGTLDISLAWTNTGACGDGAGNVIDAFNPSIVYANCQQIDILKSTNGGLSGFAPSDSGITTSDRVSFIPPLVGDNFSAGLNNLYFGTYRVWQSRNQGASWQAITNDLTNEKITRLAVAPGDRTVMYAATDDGRVWKGTGLLVEAPNNCFTDPVCFTEITLDLLPASRRINALAVSPFDPHTVYVGHAGFGTSTTRRLSRRVGNGAWTDITGNLPNIPVLDIVADPDIVGRLYVATDIGVFMSEDDGTSWLTLANGLPRVAVYGLKLHRASRTLRAATHGRGIWDLAVPVNVAGAGGILVPSNLSFANVPQDTTSVAKTLSFINNGDSPTTIGGVTLTGDYAIAANSCVGTLAASASCDISVTLTPRVAGIHFNNLTVTSNAASSPAVAGLSGLGAPPNDDFENAVIVSSGRFYHSTNTLGAATQGADPVGPCDVSNPPSAKSVWYFYTPVSSGSAVINTRGSNYDTVLSVWTGTHGSLAPVLNGCNDDIDNVITTTGLPSEVTINVVGGTTYRIMASGFAPSDGGALTLSVTGPAAATSLQGTLTFSAVVGYSSSTLPLTFLNTFGIDVTVINVTATGDYALNHGCGFVPAGQTCPINLTFSPVAAGPRNGVLTVTTSGGNRTAKLNGIGVTLSLSLSRPVRPARNSTGSTIVISPGETARVELDVNTGSGNGDAVTFDCATSSERVKCAVKPASTARALVTIVASELPRAARLGVRSGSRDSETVNVTITGRIGMATANFSFPVIVTSGKALKRAQPGRARRLQSR